MARITYVSERLTSKYVDEYAHLDRWGEGHAVKVLPDKCIREAEDFDDGGTYLRNVIARPGAPDLTRAIEQTMSKWGCAHEYDCCGCSLVRAQVKHRHGRRYVVEVDVSFNY